MTFREYQKQEFNYDCITTFWEDFAIADHFGIPAVKDTFKRAFAEWKSNYKYLAELAIVLNSRCWLHYNRHQLELSRVYADLYYHTRNYALKNLTGDEFEYYCQLTD